MGKKRSCKRTMNEKVIYKKAEKMREMTDLQLVHYVEDRVEKARSEGYNRGRAQASEYKSVNIGKIVNEIGNIRGIETIKIAEIQAILEKHLGDVGQCVIQGSR